MKANIGVDGRTKLTYSVGATAANIHDLQVLEDLFHGDETRVYGDSTYAGQKSIIKQTAPQVKDSTQKKGCWYVALTDEDNSHNKNKSKVRSEVEHLFHILKCQFGIRKERFKGLDKDAAHLFGVCALTNLVVAKTRLLKLTNVAVYL